MNLHTPEILKSLDGYQLLSDPADPYEPHYTGDYLIVERQGLQGLVRQRPDGAYDVVVPVQYPAIQYRLLHDTFRDKKYDLFWLHDQQGKAHLWRPGVATLRNDYR